MINEQHKAQAVSITHIARPRHWTLLFALYACVVIFGRTHCVQTVHLIIFCSTVLQKITKTSCRPRSLTFTCIQSNVPVLINMCTPSWT